MLFKDNDMAVSNLNEAHEALTKRIEDAKRERLQKAITASIAVMRQQLVAQLSPMFDLVMAKGAMTKQEFLQALANIKIVPPMITIPVSVGMPEFKIPKQPPPTVTVNPTPVHVAAPIVNVPAPIVNIPKMPDLPTPVVNVQSPEVIVQGGMYGLVSEPYDEIEMKYLGSNVSAVTYKMDGTHIATLQLQYDLNDNLIRVKRS